MDYGAIDTLGLAFSAYLDDLRYLHAFHFVLRHFTMDTFIPSIIPEIDRHLLLSYTSYHGTWPTPFSIMRRCRSVLDHLGCAFIHFSDFRFNIFHDGRVWQIADLLVMMLSFWQSACWVLICLFFAFRALVIIVFIRQSFLFSQHGITIHSPVWHYLFEVGHFHYMMDEHISEYSSFETFCILCLFIITYWGIPHLREHWTFDRFHSLLI